MFKAFIVIANVCAVVAMTVALNSGEVLIQHIVPATIEEGQSATVELKIDKGSLSGTSKITLKVGQNLSAEAIETDGAEASFENGELVFIWEELPAKPNINVSYKLSAVGVPGTQWIKGELSYVDGTRKTIELEHQQINIVTSSLPKVSSFRSMEEDGNGGYFVVIKVQKDTMHGYGGIKESIPSDFTAEIDRNGGAVSKYLEEESIIRFSWLEIPKDESELLVSYHITPKSEESAHPRINGYFTAEFLVFNGQSMEVPINLTSEHYTIKQKEDPIIETPPVPGLTFKVQIAAGHKDVSSNYFVTTHKFDEAFVTENHEGWIKYIIGGYNGYDQAREKRDVLRNNTNLPGPFVTVYNDGNRITVQEAMMLTNSPGLQ